MRTFLTACLAVLATAASAKPGEGTAMFLSGRQLLAICTKSGDIAHEARAMCLGYIAGQLDLWTDLSRSETIPKNAPRLCLAGDAEDLFRTAKIVVDWMQHADPRVLDQSADAAIYLALSGTLKCR